MSTDDRDNSSPPPIPAALAHLPVVGGLVVPWITPRTRDGRYLLGTVSAALTQRALRNRLCGVCGGDLSDRLVLLLRESDLPRRASAEPALHPECAAYTATACPMVAGQRDHYRSSPHTLSPYMLPGADAEARHGAPAEAWFAVWLTRYDVIVLHGHPAASYLLTPPLRIRPIAGESIRRP